MFDPPPKVEVSFLGGDYAIDERATVRVRIIHVETTLASVDLLADQALEVSRLLEDVACQVAVTERS